MVIDHFCYEGKNIRKYRRNLPLILEELREHPENTNNIRHLVLICYKLGQVLHAEEEWQRAIHIIPNKEAVEPIDSLAFSYLIESLQNRGKPARGLLDEAMSLFPNNHQLFRLNARELIAEGLFEHAIPYLNRLLRWGESDTYDHSLPYHTRIFNAYPSAYMAICLLMLGRIEESKLCCDAAITHDPENPKVESMLRPLINFHSAW